MHLPPQDQYPDYYQLIQRPVSFQLVRVGSEHTIRQLGSSELTLHLHNYFCSPA